MLTPLNSDIIGRDGSQKPGDLVSIALEGSFREESTSSNIRTKHQVESLQYSCLVYPTLVGT